MKPYQEGYYVDKILSHKQGKQYQFMVGLWDFFFALVSRSHFDLNWLIWYIMITYFIYMDMYVDLCLLSWLYRCGLEIVSHLINYNLFFISENLFYINEQQWLYVGFWLCVYYCHGCTDAERSACARLINQSKNCQHSSSSSIPTIQWMVFGVKQGNPKWVQLIKLLRTCEIQCIGGIVYAVFSDP